MPVIINFKICDNAKECGGIETCPTGALSWDEKNKTIKIDNSKCTSCGLCENACPVEAIKVAKTEKGYQEIKKEVEKDERKISDLFVDRYGAQPIDPHTLIFNNNFEASVFKTQKPTLVEFFNDDSVHCLRDSIPIKKLLKGKENPSSS